MLAIATFNVRNRGHQIRPLRNGLGLRMTDHSHSLNNQSEPLMNNGSLWTIFRIISWKIDFTQVAKTKSLV